jgi:hypothetical protein
MQASILGVWIKAAQFPQRDFLACAGEILQALEELDTLRLFSLGVVSQSQFLRMAQVNQTWLSLWSLFIIS